MGIRLWLIGIPTALVAYVLLQPTYAVSGTLHSGKQKPRDSKQDGFNRQELSGDNLFLAGQIDKARQVYEALSQNQGNSSRDRATRKISTLYEVQGDLVNAKRHLANVMNHPGSSISTDSLNALKLAYLGFKTQDNATVKMAIARGLQIQTLQENPKARQISKPVTVVATTTGDNQSLAKLALDASTRDPLLADAMLQLTGAQAVLTDVQKFKLAYSLRLADAAKSLAMLKNLERSSDVAARKASHNQLMHLRDVRDTQEIWEKQNNRKAPAKVRTFDPSGFKTNGYWPTGQKLEPTKIETPQI